MSAKNVKKEIVTCTNCGHVIQLNAWGIPAKHQSGDYMDAIERSRKKLEIEMGFGIKEEYETNKKRSRGSKKES